MNEKKHNINFSNVFMKKQHCIRCRILIILLFQSFVKAVLEKLQWRDRIDLSPLFLDPGENLTSNLPPTPVFVDTTPAVTTTAKAPETGSTQQTPTLTPSTGTAGPVTAPPNTLPTGKASSGYGYGYGWCGGKS